jgi:S1-C subfamily serine protease
MRAGALAAVSIVAACLGAAVVLVVGSAAGWIGEDGGVRTVVLPTVPTETEGSAPTAAPLVGNGFDPARIYASRSEGVVTIYSYFSNGQRAQGSGFIVSEDGHILTNSHVVTTSGADSSSVKSAGRLYVVFHDGDRIPAKIVGWDLFNDTGLVKVDPADHPVTPVPLGDSNSVVVAAIGSPFGQESSLAVGVVSATRRSIESLTSAYDVSDAIQIDAPINHGNSGGPLLDARGRVIGINAQIRSDSGNAEGVGFAIPINSARRSMEQLISTGHVAYAYVGVTTQDVTPAMSRRYKLGAPRGALIQAVVADAPAARAGLKGSNDEKVFNGVPIALGGDLIVGFAGRKVERATDIARIVTDSLLPGQTVSVTVIRRGTGKRENVRVRLTERPLNPTR